jgi:hypothetical protein
MKGLCMKFQGHVINLTPERVLFLASLRHEFCRFWFTTYGDLTGVWLSRNGVQHKVCQCYDGKVRIYL